MTVTDVPGMRAADSSSRGRSRPPGRRRPRAGSAGLMPYLLILPGFAFYALFVLVPIVGTARLSFFQWDGLLPQQWVGLDNFRSVFTDPAMLTSFKVSAAMVFFGCVLPVAVALLLVGVIARTRVKALSFFRFAYFMPYTIALAVVAIAWRWLYATDGSVNMVIGAVFGDGAVTAWLGSFTWALPAVGVVGFWATFGFVVVLLLSGAQHIPRELYDAARVDGAGAVQEFFAVTLPGIKHELRVALVMTFILAMRVFDLPLMTTQGGPGYSTTTPSLMMYRDVFLNANIGRGAAIAVVITVVIFIGVGLINRMLATED